MARNEKIGIVGSGFIGRSWAMLFASVGYDVCLYDNKQEQLSDALKEIQRQLSNLETSGLLKGKLTAAEQFKCIRGVTNLKECVEGAKHVQENVFEDLEVKKKVFKEIDQYVGPETVLATSSSCIPPSKISAELKNKANVILSHPYNPPYYVPAVEVVPAPWTSEDVVARTRALLTEIGQVPVVLTREHPGFASNRIQYAILNECNSLVRSGVLKAEDVDSLVKNGLGLRYAWMGPLETALLNANGMEDYLRRYGSSITSVSETLEKGPSWEIQDCSELISQLDQMVPQDQLQSRRDWRDKRLAALAKLKEETAEQDKTIKK